LEFESSGWATTEIPEDDPRVVRALEEYLAACERGERPVRAQFLTRHAAVAARLEECLDSLECLQSAVRHFDGSGLEDTGPFLPLSAELQPPDRLGDYRIVREIGRGGMGVVYEAEQVSLGRRVALKLLPFTAAMDPRQVQRFQVEVQAAAHLHHPHIVPIYAVGCESGVHYFAMQLISGRSLAAIIAGLRESKASNPSLWYPGSGAATIAMEASSSGKGGVAGRPGAFFRGIARLGVQAAEALEHAHSLGVVHRDIKPANLLVDHREQLWIADFGLARLQGDSGLTVTGDLLGTLRYMSPEQALAQRGVVDHRTDLYSLGVTLYELMTLQPAFQGTDIQALVHQITSEDPTPPGRINPLVPRDLETIVLKAMAKEPVNRYATAQELADDLKRFLGDQPILACRPTPTERAVRWARRHRSVVVSGAVALVLALVCLSFSTVLIWNAMARTEQESHAKEAELKRARANLKLAHQVLDLYLNTAESWFPRDPGGDMQEGTLLKTALTYYEQIASQNGADPEVKAPTFAAYSRVGDIRAALGDGRGAEEAYRKAMAIMVELLDREPVNDSNRTRMAEVLEKFSNLLRRQTIYVPAEWSINESVRLRQQVLDRNPGDPGCRLALAHAQNQMASLKGDTGRIQEALAETQHALDLLLGIQQVGGTGGQAPLGVEWEMASVYNNLGKWLQLGGKLSEAEQVYRKGLGLLERIQAEAPRVVPATRESLASSQAMLGELLRATKRNEAAEAMFKRAIGGLEQLAADYPRIPRYKKQVARIYVALSTLYSEMDRSHESVDARHKAITHDPRLLEGQHVHMNNLAWYLVTAPNPAARNPARGLELAARAVALAPESWASWNTLGVARYRNGDWNGAKDALETALQKHRGENAFDGFFLAMTLWRLGQQEPARDWLRRAEGWRLRNLPSDVELLRFRAEAEALVGSFPCHHAASPPPMPSSVAEALKDPSFGLPRFCPAPAPQATGEQDCQTGATHRTEPALRISDHDDHALFFIGLI
jgi:serine/threonine protein kinase/tetratricopeptide (TPR) repeat protein